MVAITVWACSAFTVVAAERLDSYWPLNAPQRGWRLVDHATRSKHMMTVTHVKLDNNNFQVWFSDKPGQKPGDFDIEQFRYCENAGGDPWLWLEKFIDFDRNSGSWIEHSVQSTKILFTPEDGEPQDLIADGTYARCGGRGQPYLFFNQTLSRYRIQVWGTIDRDRYPSSNWQWYWDATVYATEDLCNDCLPTQKVVKAIKVKEAWWSNFPGEGGWTGGRGGTIGTNGLPTGEEVVPFRTVWHAEGQLPYYVIGTVSEAPNWCTNAIWEVNPEPKLDSKRKQSEQDKPGGRGQGP